MNKLQTSHCEPLNAKMHTYAIRWRLPRELRSLLVLRLRLAYTSRVTSRISPELLLLPIGRQRRDEGKHQIISQYDEVF